MSVIQQSPRRTQHHCLIAQLVARHPDVLCVVGIHHALQDNEKRALSCFHQTIERDPTHGEAHLWLGLLSPPREIRRASPPPIPEFSYPCVLSRRRTQCILAILAETLSLRDGKPFRRVCLHIISSGQKPWYLRTHGTKPFRRPVPSGSFRPVKTSGLHGNRTGWPPNTSPALGATAFILPKMSVRKVAVINYCSRAPRSTEQFAN